MGFLCVIYLIAALRTNVIFVVMFISLIFTFSFLAGSFWQTANGAAALALKLQIGGGGCAFVTCVLGWYLFFVQILDAVDFPLSLPVGDLSTLIRGRNERKNA